MMRRSLFPGRLFVLLRSHSSNGTSAGMREVEGEGSAGAQDEGRLAANFNALKGRRGWLLDGLIAVSEAGRPVQVLIPPASPWLPSGGAARLPPISTETEGSSRGLLRPSMADPASRGPGLAGRPGGGEPCRRCCALAAPSARRRLAGMAGLCAAGKVHGCLLPELPGWTQGKPSPRLPPAA